jgi:hypothetical protein
MIRTPQDRKNIYLSYPFSRKGSVTPIIYNSRLYIRSHKIVRIAVIYNRSVPWRIVRTGLYITGFFSQLNIMGVFSIMCVDSQYYDDWACSCGISIIAILKKQVGLSSESGYIIRSLSI